MQKRIAQWISRQISRARIGYFSHLSTTVPEGMPPRLIQPALLLGQGRIVFGKDVILGYSPSPYLHSTYIHIEARQVAANIQIGNRVMINNNLAIICEGSQISIGDDCLIGPSCIIVDSDFHHLDPKLRRTGTPRMEPVMLGCNVFVGANVTILRGTSIGDNSVVGAGAVVSGSYPPNVVIGGNPARVLKSLESTFVE